MNHKNDFGNIIFKVEKQHGGAERKKTCLFLDIRLNIHLNQLSVMLGSLNHAYRFFFNATFFKNIIHANKKSKKALKYDQQLT